jgi:hypothetical protein
MKARSSLLVALSVLLGALTFMAFDFVVDRPASAQSVPAPAVGRYQVTITSRESVSTVFVFDAHTGQCWYRSTPDDKWTDMGSPARK